MEKTQRRDPRPVAERTRSQSRNSVVRSARHRQKKNQSQPLFGLTTRVKQSATNRFALCIRSEGEDDLVLFKLYKVLPDESAARDDFIRIVDESGEDYLYHNSRFVMIAVPKEIERVLTLAG